MPTCASQTAPRVGETPLGWLPRTSIAFWPANRFRLLYLEKASVSLSHRSGSAKKASGQFALFTGKAFCVSVPLNRAAGMALSGAGGTAVGVGMEETADGRVADGDGAVASALARAPARAAPSEVLGSSAGCTRVGPC